MTYLENFFTTVIHLNIYLIILISIVYIVIHQHRHKSINQFLDVYLNYIPVLTHEFGHVLFNRLAGGRAKDLVIVTSLKNDNQPCNKATPLHNRELSWTIHYYHWRLFNATDYVLIGLVAALSTPKYFPSIISIYFYLLLILTSRKLSPIIVILLIGILLYFLFKHDNQMIMYDIVSLSYHFILGVLLGKFFNPHGRYLT